MKAQVDDRIDEMINPGDHAEHGHAQIAHVLIDDARLYQQQRVGYGVDFESEIENDELNGQFNLAGHSR